MGVLVIPKKVVVTAKPVASDLSDFADLIDLVGSLQDKAVATVAKIKALQEELKPLKKAEADLQAAIDALPLDADAIGDIQLGETFKIEVGRKGSSRSITSMEKVLELMGEELFMKLATVTLKSVDDYLNPAQKLECIATTRGARSYKLARRPKAK